MPNVGLIDFALSPPIGLLNPHLDGNGPYGSGNHILTTWDDGGLTRPVADTFGIQINFNGAIPPFLGLKPGFDDGNLVIMDQFELRLVQLVALHQFFGGAWTVTQLEGINTLPLTFRWAEALPGKVGLYVAPHISIDVWFLLL